MIPTPQKTKYITHTHTKHNNHNTQLPIERAKLREEMPERSPTLYAVGKGPSISDIIRYTISIIEHTPQQKQETKEKGGPRNKMGEDKPKPRTSLSLSFSHLLQYRGSR